MGRLALAVMKSLAPATYAHHSLVRARLLSESIVFVAARIREVLSELCARGDADYLCREAAARAGPSMAIAARLTADEAEEFTRTLSHVLLQHAHFPPSDDDQALVRLVASRERKLSVGEAVRVIRKLMGPDPLLRTEPWAFARSWLLLRGEPWGAIDARRLASPSGVRRYWRRAPTYRPRRFRLRPGDARTSGRV